MAARLPSKINRLTPVLDAHAATPPKRAPFTPDSNAVASQWSRPADALPGPSACDRQGAVGVIEVEAGR